MDHFVNLSFVSVIDFYPCSFKDSPKMPKVTGQTDLPQQESDSKTLKNFRKARFSGSDGETALNPMAELPVAQQVHVSARARRVFPGEM